MTSNLGVNCLYEYIVVVFRKGNKHAKVVEAHNK